MALITKYLAFDIIILLISFFFLAYLYATRNFNYWKKRGVFEAIKPIPIFGNYWSCLMGKKSCGHLYKDIYDQSAPHRFAGLHIFDRPCFLVRDPEIVKHILLKDFNCFNDRYVRAGAHDELGKSNLFLIQSPKWKVVRTKLTPLYTSGRLKKMFEFISEIGDDLMRYMESMDLKGDGKILEMKEVCAKYTTDTIATTAFGIKSNALFDPNSEFREFGRDVFEGSLLRNIEFSSIFMSHQLVKLVKSKFFSLRGEKFIRKAVWDVITEREKTNSKRCDMIDLLMELRKGTDEAAKQIFHFDGDNLVAQCAIFFNGGFESSSSTMSFTVYELALQPDIQTRLRDEIFEALEANNGKVTYDLLMGLPYLDMCIAETLRKYPTLPFLDRIAAYDYHVPNSDLILEKGSHVVISVTGFQYDEQYFPDPYKYDPERWSEENKRNIKPFVYLPFGEGPRICIGMRLGLLQIKFGLIKLLSKYEFTPCKETVIPLPESTRNVLVSVQGGINLNVRQIS